MECTVAAYIEEEGTLKGVHLTIVVGQAKHGKEREDSLLGSGHATS